MGNHTNSTVGLPTNMCILLNMPDSRVDCLTTIYNTSECIRCRVLGRFLAGEDLSEVGATGHVVCILIWLLTCLVGIFGAFGNMLIVYILHRQKRGVAFDTLLISLAWIDMLCCWISLVPSTSAIVYFGKKLYSVNFTFNFFSKANKQLFC